MDTLRGLALIATFIGFLIIFAMWVSLWENVRQAAVEPTRPVQSTMPYFIALANIRLARRVLGHGGGRSHSAMLP